MTPYYDKDGITIYHGDARHVLPHIATGSVSSIVTDPPYGMNLQPQRGATKAIEGDERRMAKSLWWAVMPDCIRVLQDNSKALFFGRWSEEWAKPVLEEFFTVKGCIVWVKNVWGIGYYIRPQWELCWYCHKGEPEVPDDAPSDVWDFRKVHEQIHSCEKPVALLKNAVRMCGPGTVLDPFMGVGSTLRAAKDEGRKAIGIEIEEEYCEAAVQRLRQGVLNLTA